MVSDFKHYFIQQVLTLIISHLTPLSSSLFVLFHSCFGAFGCAYSHSSLVTKTAFCVYVSLLWVGLCDSLADICTGTLIKFLTSHHHHLLVQMVTLVLMVDVVYPRISSTLSTTGTSMSTSEWGLATPLSLSNSAHDESIKAANSIVKVLFVRLLVVFISLFMSFSL